MIKITFDGAQGFISDRNQILSAVENDGAKLVFIHCHVRAVND